MSISKSEGLYEYQGLYEYLKVRGTHLKVRARTLSESEGFYLKVRGTLSQS